MKLPVAVTLALSTTAFAQSAKPPIHRTALAASKTASASAPCAVLPPLSSKIPALPPGLPCPKPLYTITSTPNVSLTYVSPLEGSGLRETLGLESSSFSLDYVDTKIGSGQIALPHKWYSIHYTGFLTDGTKFDSSLDRGEPIVIQYGAHSVIPGWDTGFDGMRVGGKRRLFVPYQLAYGPNQHQSIPGKSMLIFDVELVKVSETKPDTPPPAAKPAAAAPAPGAIPTRPPAATPGIATPGTATPGTAPKTIDPTRPTTVPPPTDPTKPATTPPATTPTPSTSSKP